MLDSGEVKEHLKKMGITPESVGSGTFDRVAKDLHKATRSEFITRLNGDPETRKAMDYHKLNDEILRKNHEDLYYHLKH